MRTSLQVNEHHTMLFYLFSAASHQSIRLTFFFFLPGFGDGFASQERYGIYGHWKYFHCQMCIVC